MATERLSMRKTREVLRLKWVLGRSHREIAVAVGVGTATVSKASSRARVAGLDWAAVERLSEDELEARRYPAPPGPGTKRALPDPARMHLELRRPGVTLRLLHVEYLEQHPDGYGYPGPRLLQLKEDPVLIEPTMEKLRALKLDALAAAWIEQQKNAEIAALSFDERVGLLVEAQWLARENKRLRRSLTEAKLRQGPACMEDIDFAARREIDKAQIRQLAACRWVVEHHNIAITGMTGTGKTYLACALAQQACRKGYRALYRRAPRLFEELLLARADGTYSRLLDRIARIDVLVVDDWGLAPLKDQERRDLLEIFEDRDGVRSTIVTSQVPTTRWHDHLGDPTLADAILDRLLNCAHRVMLKGPSRRKEKTTET